MAPIERDPEKGLNGAVAAVLRGERAAMRARLTQDEVADLAEMPVVSLRRYLNGKRPIDMATLDAICKAMGITAEYVMSRAHERVVVSRSPDTIDPEEAQAALDSDEIAGASEFDD